MAGVDTCLSDDALREFLAGNLSPDESERIESHLRTCQPCRDQRDALVNRHQSWIDLLQQAGVPRALGELQTSTDDSVTAIAELIPGYRVIEEVSRGGQGIVYRATQLSTHRAVAIKVLREGPFASAEDRRRFEREIDLIAGFRHPGIVTVFDSGATSDGRPYCVMDYVEGARLDRYLKQHPLVIEAILALFVRICAAVNYAHQRGVIHRDLKPGNVLVTDADQSDGAVQPHVLDFGLAKRVSAIDQTQLTETGLVAGTLPYLAPEQTRASNTQDVDIRSDVYSLGVMLFEALAGKYPYPVRGDLSEVLQHIKATPASKLTSKSNLQTDDTTASTPLPTDLARLRTDRRDEIETIVHKALAKEPARRYQTVGELAADIERFLRREPIEAKRDSGWYVLRKLFERRRKTVVAGLAFVGLLTASVIGLSVLYYRAQTAEAKASQRLDDMREVSRTFIFKLAGQISHLSGATKARQTLAESAVKYLNRIADDVAPDDLEMHSELATAYALLGDIYGDKMRPNLGKYEEATQCLEKSLQHALPVLQALPHDPAIRKMFIRTENRLARLYGVIGDRAMQQEHEDSAYAMAQSLVTDHADSNIGKGDLADCLALRADRALRNDAIDDAIDLHRQALALLSSRGPDANEPAYLLHDRASSYGALARACMQKGDLHGALEFRQQCLAYLKRAVEIEPTSMVYQRDCAIAHECLGNALRKLGRAREALTEFSEGLKLIEPIAEDNPRDLKARTTRASLYCYLGELAIAENNWEDSKSHFEVYLSIAQKNALLAPKDSKSRRELGVAHYKFVELHRKRAETVANTPAAQIAELRQAQAACRAALAVFNEMVEDQVLELSDAGVPAMLQAELTSLDEQLSAMDASAITESADKAESSTP